MNTPSSLIRKHKKTIFCSHLNGRYNSSFRNGINMMNNNNTEKSIVSYSNGVSYVNMIWVNRHIGSIPEYNPNREV